MNSKLAQTWCMDYKEAIWQLCMVKSWIWVPDLVPRHHTRMMSPAAQFWPIFDAADSPRYCKPSDVLRSKFELVEPGQKSTIQSQIPDLSPIKEFLSNELQIGPNLVYGLQWSYMAAVYGQMLVLGPNFST